MPILDLCESPGNAVRSRFRKKAGLRLGLFSVRDGPAPEFEHEWGPEATGARRERRDETRSTESVVFPFPLRLMMVDRNKRGVTARSRGVQIDLRHQDGLVRRRTDNNSFRTSTTANKPSTLVTCLAYYLVCSHAGFRTSSFTFRHCRSKRPPGRGTLDCLTAPIPGCFPCRERNGASRAVPPPLERPRQPLKAPKCPSPPEARPWRASFRSTAEPPRKLTLAAHARRLRSEPASFKGSIRSHEGMKGPKSAQSIHYWAVSRRFRSLAADQRNCEGISLSGPKPLRDKRRNEIFPCTPYIV